MKKKVALVVALALLSGHALAYDFADLGTISPTTTLTNNHLCYSDGRDIACADRDFVVTPDGNVGIGTNSPSGTLHVYDSANDAGFYFDGDAGGYPRLYVGGGSSSVAMVVNRQVSSSTIYFGETSDTGGYSFRGAGDHLIEGNVGIGTTSPDTALHVSGTLMIADGNETCSGGNYAGGLRYSGGNIEFCDGVSDWQALATGAGADTDWVEGSGTVYNLSDKVGIGTSNPTVPLAISSTVNNQQFHVGSGLQRLELGYDVTNDYGRIQSVYVTNAAKPLALQPAGGNVGIGTTAPSTSLHVAGDATVSGTIQIAEKAGGEVCSTAADYGKVIFDASRGKMRLCRP